MHTPHCAEANDEETTESEAHQCAHQGHESSSSCDRVVCHFRYLEHGYDRTLTKCVSMLFGLIKRRDNGRADEGRDKVECFPLPKQ